MAQFTVIYIDGVNTVARYYFREKSSAIDFLREIFEEWDVSKFAHGGPSLDRFYEKNLSDAQRRMVKDRLILKEIEYTEDPARAEGWILQEIETED
jgi:hypothetical protein